jgi:hypothetical protein
MISESVQFSFMVRPSSDLYIFSATVLDFLLPNRLHTWARPDAFAAWGNTVAPLSERTLGVGYGALLLALVALVMRPQRVALWGVAALFFLLVALGPRMHALTIGWEEIPPATSELREESLYALLNNFVPFMRISRSVSRFAIVVQLCVAVLAGVGLAWWLQQVRGAWRTGVSVAALIVVLAESWVAPYPMSPPDTPAYYATLAQSPGEAQKGAILNLPMNYDRPGYLLYQTVHGRPLTVAYISRDDPRTLTERVPLLQHWRHLGPDIIEVDPVQVGLSVLYDLGVTTVVLDRYKMPGGEERTYTEGLAAALFADIAPSYSDERITVYAVPSPSRLQPYLALGPVGWGPLVESDGVRYRTVSDEATLLLHHAERGAQVMIDYIGDGAGEVRSADGTVWMLPAAPEGGTITIELPPGIDQVTLISPTGEVRVTRIALTAN